MIRRLAAFVCVSVAIGGCGWLSDQQGFIVDRSKDYLTAQERPPLVVPDDLTSATIHNSNAIPAITSNQRRLRLDGEAPRPETIYAREETASVRIQKLGDQRWLLVPQVPAVVWPKVKQFFADNGVAVVLDEPQSGRLDTDWLVVDNATARDIVRESIAEGRKSAGITGGRDRVQVLVEPGLRDRSTEIRLRYQTDATGESLDTLMVAQSDLPEVETRLLNELGGYIAANVGDASISYVARNISTQSKAELVRDASDRPVLRLNLDFDRAWATVNQALTEAKLDVTDVDRSSGMFYVTVTDQMLNQEEKPSIFTRWFNRENKRRLELFLAPESPGFQLTVLDMSGQPAPSDVAEQLLIMIREFAT